MPTLSKRQRELKEAAEAATAMRAQMIKFFGDSLNLVQATADPVRIKSMVDAYSKVMGFYEEAPDKVITPQGKELPATTQEDTRRALARLMQKQAESDTNPPESETIPTELTDQA